MIYFIQNKRTIVTKAQDKLTQRGSNLIKSTQNQIVAIYHFPIDLDPNGRPFGSKSIGAW